MATSPAPISKAYAAYKPPQWAKPAMVSITVPPRAAATPVGPLDIGTDTIQGYNVTTSILSAAPSNPTTYVFDAVLSLDHEQALVKTMHPVQTGAALSTHAYLEPAHLVMYVLMSDAVGSYTGGVNQSTAPYVQAWTGNPSKSVSAYAQMLSLQASRSLLTVTTRLRTYNNMLVMKVTPREDEKTITGARFRLEFSQVFLASTQQADGVGARPDETDNTGLGAVSTASPSETIVSQFGLDQVPAGAEINPFGPSGNLLGWLATHPDGVQVPGAGSFSSSNINTLQTTPSP
jgi:hypothetical protein